MSDCLMTRVMSLCFGGGAAKGVVEIYNYKKVGR